MGTYVHKNTHTRKRKYAFILFGSTIFFFVVEENSISDILYTWDIASTKRRHDPNEIVLG